MKQQQINNALAYQVPGSTFRHLVRFLLKLCAIAISSICSGVLTYSTAYAYSVTPVVAGSITTSEGLALPFQNTANTSAITFTLPLTSGNTVNAQADVQPSSFRIAAWAARVVTPGSGGALSPFMREYLADRFIYPADDGGFLQAFGPMVPDANGQVPRTIPGTLRPGDPNYPPHPDPALANYVLEVFDAAGFAFWNSPFDGGYLKSNPVWYCSGGLIYTISTNQPGYYRCEGNYLTAGYVIDIGQNGTITFPNPDPAAIEAQTLPAVKPLPTTANEPIPVEITFPQPNIDGEAYTDPSTGNRVKTRYLVEPGPGLTSLANGGQIAPPTVNVTETVVPASSAEYPPKNNGGCMAGVPMEGNPINASIGNKWQSEIDIDGVTAPGFARMYNSNPAAGNSSLGNGWAHTYARSINAQPFGPGMRVSRQDGKIYVFNAVGGGWTSEGDIPDQLVELKDASGIRTGWRYTVAADDSVETYSTSGKLLSIADRSGRTQTLVYDLPSTSGGDDDPETLDTVTDDAGRQIVFTYDEQKRIATISDPSGGLTWYGYDEQNNLVSVSYPDASGKTYHYNEPGNTSGADLPHALTGITDENGTRYATFTYDANGKAISTSHAGGADLFSMSYNADNSTTVTDPLGAQRTHTLTTVLGVVKSTGQSQPGGSGCGPAASSMAYDANGNVSSTTDFNGTTSCYAYDARNLETVRVEGLASGKSCPADPTTLASYVPAAGTVERKISTQWNAVYHLPNVVAEPLKLTTYVYNDPSGANCAPGASPALLCSRTEQATTDTTGAQGLTPTVTGKPRTWSFTYVASGQGLPGQVQTVTGPRGQLATNDPDYAPAITTYTYYTDTTTDHKPGDLKSVALSLAAAQSIVTTYDHYDGNGRVLQTTDPNGTVTTFAYYPRGWLYTRTVGGKTTTYTYKPWGDIEQITYPDATFVSYGYDDAHRLTSIADSAGQSVNYTLDGMGNRTNDSYVNTDGSSARQFNRVFDALNKLQQEIDGLNNGSQAPRTYTYYANGERQSSTTPKGYGTTGYTTTYAIDALGRTTQMQDPINGSAKPTLMSYDGLDQLIGVTAPNGAATTYAIDGLGNLNQETSSDSGTHQATYDVAGNLKTLLDARNLTLGYTYDALNRVKSISIPAAGNQPASTITYTWDSASGCTHGIGHLCQVSDASGTTTYDYDARGNRLTQTRVENGQTLVTHFAVNDANRPVAVITPTSETVAATLDAAGLVDSLSSTQGSTTTPIAQDIRYAATGQISSQTLGQTQITQSFDPAGRPTDSGGPGSGPAIVLGDLNDDGIVDVADVALAMRIALGLVVPSSSQLQHGDINGDGVIDTADVMHIQRKALGLENF